jgi:hypothetical protein
MFLIVPNPHLTTQVLSEAFLALLFIRCTNLRELGVVIEEEVKPYDLSHQSNNVCNIF